MPAVLAHAYTTLRLYSGAAIKAGKRRTVKPALQEWAVYPAHAAVRRLPRRKAYAARHNSSHPQPEELLEQLKWRKLRRTRRRTLWAWETHTSRFADLPARASSPLDAQPGLARFLNLRPLQECPGMVFDLQSETLSLHPFFPERLHYVRDVVHHEVKPWINKAFTQRAEAWRLLDRADFLRVRDDQKDVALNRTRARHRGNVMNQPAVLLNMALPGVDKPKYKPFSVRWPVNLGVDLPSRWLGHLDGMKEDDAAVFVEFHGKKPILTSILFTINSSYSQAQATWSALAQGRIGRTNYNRRSDINAFTPLLMSFCRWLKQTYQDQKAGPKLYKNYSSPESGPLPVLRDSMPEAQVVPVIFAFRQKYIWFLWKGGIQGKLEAQYASHWLPVWPGEDWDAKCLPLKRKLLKQYPYGADTVPVTSDTPRRIRLNVEESSSMEQSTVDVDAAPQDDQPVSDAMDNLLGFWVHREKPSSTVAVMQTSDEAVTHTSNVATERRQNSKRIVPTHQNSAKAGLEGIGSKKKTGRIVTNPLTPRKKI